MSDIIYTGADSFNIGGFDFTKKNHGKDKKLFALKIIVAIIAILLVMEGLMYLFLVPCFSKPEISYSGLENVSQSEIEENLAEMKNVSWIKFNTSDAITRIRRISAVENASVTKVFPKIVKIEIFERKAVAKTLVELNGFSVPFQIDKNGVLFLSKSNSFEDSSVPLVSGLPVSNMSEGMRLPVNYRTLMSEISDIKKLQNRYFDLISEIQVVPKEYGNYELVLYPIRTHIRVLTDRILNESALQYMTVVLDVVNEIEPDVCEVDLRYGAVSYRTR